MVELRPSRLADEYLFRPGKLDRHKEEEVKRRFERRLSEFERGKIRLDASDDGLLELAFYAALISSGLSSSQIRRIYSGIGRVREECRRAMEGQGSWDDVVTELHRVYVLAAYTVGRQSEFSQLYRLLEVALSKAERAAENFIEKGETERAERVIEALHFLVQSVVAFRKFLENPPRT